VTFEPGYATGGAFWPMECIMSSESTEPLYKAMELLRATITEGFAVAGAELA
jgi:hypothetical protein